MKTLSAIEAKFLRTKTRFKSTKLWKDANNSVKAFISDIVNLCNDEAPIICFYLSANNWWVLTNTTLLVFDEHFFSIKLAEIEAVEMKKLFDGEVLKTECSAVQLKVYNKYIDLQVEKSAWPITFMILQFVSG